MIAALFATLCHSVNSLIVFDLFVVGCYLAVLCDEIKLHMIKNEEVGLNY
jgi:hypothetical protein